MISILADFRPMVVFGLGKNLLFKSDGVLQLCFDCLFVSRELHICFKNPILNLLLDQIFVML